MDKVGQLPQRKKSLVVFVASFLVCFTFNKVVNLKKGWDLSRLLLEKTGAENTHKRHNKESNRTDKFAWFIAFRLL